MVYDLEFERAFPPDDLVGHFVISLAAAHNDLSFTNRILYPPANPDRSGLSEAENIALLRQLLAQLWEVHLLVKTASEIPEVDEFIERLGREYPGDKLDGSHLVAVLRGDGGASVPRFRNVLRIARNATNHYLKPGDTDLITALESLRGQKAILRTGERMPDVRAEFADEVVWRAGVHVDDVDALAELFAATADSVVAVVHLAQAAMDIWLGERGMHPVSDGDDPPS